MTGWPTVSALRSVLTPSGLLSNQVVDGLRDLYGLRPLLEVGPKESMGMSGRRSIGHTRLCLESDMGLDLSQLLETRDRIAILDASTNARR